MSTAWIDRADVATILQRQADCVAEHLGHQMTGWERAPAQRGTFVSRCAKCSDIASVNVSCFRRAPISGAAVELRCKGRRAAAPAVTLPRAAGRH